MKKKHSVLKMTDTADSMYEYNSHEFNRNECSSFIEERFCPKESE